MHCVNFCLLVTEVNNWHTWEFFVGQTFEKNRHCLWVEPAVVGLLLSLAPNAEEQEEVFINLQPRV